MVEVRGQHKTRVEVHVSRQAAGRRNKSVEEKEKQVTGELTHGASKGGLRAARVEKQEGNNEAARVASGVT